MIFDIVPTHGYRMLTDGFPGIIVSDDDFAINSAGIMVTETTIAGFYGFDPHVDAAVRFSFPWGRLAQTRL